MLDSARGIVFQSILEVVSDYVENVRIASMKAEQFLAFVAGTRKFLKIGQAFGMMSKTALVKVHSIIDVRCENFWQEYHGNNLMTLRVLIDSEMWLIPEGIASDALDIDAAHIHLPAELCEETAPGYADIVSSGAADPFRQYAAGDTSEGAADRKGGAEGGGEQARPGAYTRTSLKLIELCAVYMHMVQILHTMADTVVQGVGEMLQLYTHSVYMICGTTATVRSDDLPGEKDGKEGKKGLKKSLKAKAASKAASKAARCGFATTVRKVLVAMSRGPDNRSP